MSNESKFITRKEKEKKEKKSGPYILEKILLIKKQSAMLRKEVREILVKLCLELEIKKNMRQN